MSWPTWKLLKIDANATMTTVDAWNDLWQRSTATMPTGRWEHILNWQQHFCRGNSVQAITVELDGQLVAALPLQTAQVARVIPVWRSLWNHWAWAGDLLVDWSVPDLAAVMDQLVLGIQSWQRPWLWFDAVPLEQPVWQQFIAALSRRNLIMVNRPRFDIGQIEIHGDTAPADFAAYEANWSGNFRRQMRKMQRRATELGGVELEVIKDVQPDQIPALLARGFNVEDRGWKGTAGSSVIRNPAMLNFYTDQARLLAEQGQLELAYLVHQGRDIAFEYGWFSKGIYYTPKVGYDEEFAHLSPGQLIRYLLLERFFADPSRQVFDFIGPLVEATAKWTTRKYQVSGLIVSTGHWCGNSLLKLARDYGPQAINGMKRVKQLFGVGK